ncbi:copper chaperone PCu(A)C [Erythrobacter sp. F6033]|uniref:copper chaperone PCu(A)C n=1 Tax=Erythrobacter sp. F6033 TaxID=2926401 RepID=UPI001FF6EE51|nr:copper chaperone PCu(A)C [Erythrobacter sp. F6033]MCK0128385.1 copper chaperone PCu(A)C [Erythrobacter sp. F6033]
MITPNKSGRALKSVLAAATLAGTVTLSACGGEADTAVEEVAGTIPGMSIENPRMVLNAVEGNPAAVYFKLKYDADRGLSIATAEVAQAGSSTLHDYGEYDFKVQMMEALPITLTKGTEVEFKPGGLHVMAFDPSPELKPGSKAEVTLRVSGGQTHTFEAEVLAAGDERAAATGDEG